MKFFTPERKKNMKWVEENRSNLILEYNGKLLLISEQEILETGNSEEALRKNAKKLGLKEEEYIIAAVGTANPKTSLSM